MTELALRNWMIENGLSVKDGGLLDRIAALDKAIRVAIPPKTQSDRTCFRKVINWLYEKIQSGRFKEDEILPIVIDYALEASNPEVRKPPAVFMYILKKELGYPN